MVAKIPRAAYNALVTCAAKGDTRYAMNGILVQAIEDRLYFVSSDTHRLMVHVPMADLYSEDELKPFGPCKIKGAVNAKTGKPEMLDRHGIIILTKSFVDRAIKPGKSKYGSDRVTVDLDNIRQAEQPEGDCQFPRWREVVPTGFDMVPALKHYMQGEGDGTEYLISGLCVNMRYVIASEDLISLLGGTLRAKDGNSPLFIESGARPWNPLCAKKERDLEYSGYVVMPISQRS